MTDKRMRAIRNGDKHARSACKQLNWPYEPDQFWAAYFAVCADDPWMRGDVANPKNPNWKQNLWTLIDSERFGQVMDLAIAAMREAE